MTSQAMALWTAAIIFLLVSILHAMRLILRTKVTIGRFVIPLWLSGLGLLVGLSLAIWMISVINT